VYYMKRFFVTGIARDKEYDLTQGKPGSRVVYFTANPNGEAEVIRVQLKPALHLKKIEVTKDLSELTVKSRTARGNVLTKYEVKSITLKQKGRSTLGGRKVWFDPDVLRINYDGQGTYLGEFVDEDRILVITTAGDYYLTTFDLTAHFDKNIRIIEKFRPEKVWSLVQWNAELGYYYGKRFTLDAQFKPQRMTGDSDESRIILLSDREDAVFRIRFADGREPSELLMQDFIEAKSPRAKGKRLTTLEVEAVEDITPEPEPEPEDDPESGQEPEESPDAEPETEPADSEPAGRDHPEETAPAAQAAQEQTSMVADVPFTVSVEVPESSRPVDDQLSLF